MQIKRLFYDIETSLGVYLHFGNGWRENINPDATVKEPQIICISYSWEGSDKVHTLHWGKGKNPSDKKLLKRFVKVMEQAHETVAHNGDKFDLNYVRQRCIKHGIDFSPFKKTIDTYRWSKNNLKLSRHGLKFLCNYYGVEQKMDNSGFDLWKKLTLTNDPESLEEMVLYCEQDIKALKSLFEKLRPYMKVKTHIGVMSYGDKHSCPGCGSFNVQYKDNYTTAMGTTHFYFTCREKSCKTSFKMSGKTYQDYIKHIARNSKRKKAAN